MALNIVPPPVVTIREKGGTGLTTWIDDTQTFEDLFSHDNFFLALQTGRESLLTFLCDNIQKLFSLALSDSELSQRAFSVLQSERLPLLYAVLDHDLLSEFADRMFADPSDRLFVRFVTLVTLCLTKCTRRACNRIPFFRKFAHVLDEPCVMDMFASLASVRTELRSVVEDFLICSNIVSELLQVVTEKPEDVYRVMSYLARLETVKSLLASPEVLLQLVNLSEHDEIEVAKCKWKFFEEMLSDVTYPILGPLAKPAENIILAADAFRQREGICFDFVTKCCSLDDAFADELQRSGFIRDVLGLVWRIPSNIHLQLRVARLCEVLSRTGCYKADVVAFDVIQFAVLAIRQREENIPMAAVAWSMLRKMGCDLNCLPEDVRSTVERLNGVADTTYGGDAPEKIDYEYTLTPDELISFFKVVLRKK